MRVQSTGLPYRCLGGLSADINIIDITVPFNPAPNKIKTVFKNIDAYNEAVCYQKPY